MAVPRPTQKEIFVVYCMNTNSFVINTLSFVYFIKKPVQYLDGAHK